MQAPNAPVVTNTGSNRGFSFFGKNIVSQVVTGLAIVTIIYIVLSLSEFIYNSFMRMWKDRVELFPKTYASGSRMYTAIQNPLNPNAKTIYFSENQRSGIEFSYSMFIYLSSETFASGFKNLYHIMHKGYSKAYPLMGPGIFAWGDDNKLRVYMNCYDTWNNFTDIDNIPIDKWFHLVVSCKGDKCYIYINGNLKSKLSLSGNTPPYQNYGDVYLFSSKKMTVNSVNTTSLLKDNSSDPATLTFDGSAKGMASRVCYFSYALTYTEIQALMNIGPSRELEGNNMNITPYLSDTWWANENGP
jgi:hypothetical protein